MDPCDDHSFLATDGDRASSNDMVGSNPASKEHIQRGPTMMQHFRKDVGGRKKLAS